MADSLVAVLGKPAPAALLLEEEEEEGEGEQQRRAADATGDAHDEPGVVVAGRRARALDRHDVRLFARVRRALGRREGDAAGGAEDAHVCGARPAAVELQADVEVVVAVVVGVDVFVYVIVRTVAIVVAVVAFAVAESSGESC